MCHDNVRDGAVTTTIPTDLNNCYGYDCNNDLEYGMQENYDYYNNCKLRERNQGLFTADQNVKGTTAKYTRQNPNGNRYGYECPEERDYYPYWQPSPWRDIAVMTNNARMCPYYQQESANVKSKWACVVPSGYLKENINSRTPVVPTNKRDCEYILYPEDDENGERGVWREFPSHNIPPPECHETEWTRDNHLGNGKGGYPNVYNWTIPDDIIHEHCVLRMRYNISTGEFDGWDPNVNSTLNSNGNEPSTLDIHTRLGFSSREEAAARGYVYEQNPVVEIFDEFTEDGKDFGLELAINTNQYGRVFQDRSHSFAIRKRPESLQSARIYNFNVRGKRGNIVQVYPAVEYDFVPNTLRLSKDDYVHIQWTGSNTNPNNNDGQGLAGTDRSNLVLLGEQVYTEGENSNPYEPYNKYGHLGLNTPMHLDNVTFLGLNQQDLINLAVLNPNQFRGELSELDDAGTYFDLGPRKTTENGHYHFMCTRNNNFSNRSQKGKILTVEQIISGAAIGWNGGNLTIDGLAGIHVERDTLDDLYKFQMEVWAAKQGEAAMHQIGRQISVGTGYASDYVVLHPQQKVTQDDKTFTMKIKVTHPTTEDIAVYRSNADTFSSWHRVSAVKQGDSVLFETQEGGVYVVRTESDVAAIVGIVLGCLAAIIIIVGTVIYFRRHPDKWNRVTHSCSRAKKSTQSKV
ncbi:protein DD3-3-like [Saccoglossus kowalevskii]